MFGLPEGYLDGKGHHADWEKKKDEGKGKGKKKPATKSKVVAAKTTNTKMTALR